ncbi:MAG: hypothetical protein AB1485_03935 [Candidatus Thermoplasmatota archaeon]
MAISKEKAEEVVTLEPLPAKPIPLEPLKKKGARGAIAGTILILASIFAMLSWVCAVILFRMIKVDLPFQIVGAVWIAIFATIALLGGVLALARKGWKVTLLCSILGVLSFGFFISMALCALALIILLFAKKEFS